MSSGRSDNHERNNRGRSRSFDRSGSYAEMARRDSERRDNNRTDRSHNNGRDHTVTVVMAIKMTVVGICVTIDRLYD